MTQAREAGDRDYGATRGSERVNIQGGFASKVDFGGNEFRV